MSDMPRQLVTGVATLFAMASVACGQSTSQPSPVAAERAVAEFYSWYVPAWPGSIRRAVDERRAQFAAPLVKALRADWAATAQGGEEIAGLEADPFLNTRDPCKHYRTTGATRRGNDYLVEVLGEGGCRTHKTPGVIVQVAWRDGHPVFVNFLYSRKRADDLLSLLKGYAAQRRRDARLFQ